MRALRILLLLGFVLVAGCGETGPGVPSPSGLPEFFRAIGLPFDAWPDDELAESGIGLADNPPLAVTEDGVVWIGLDDRVVIFRH